MGGNANALRWDGGAGHYEVYYLTVTDPATGTGVWIRYTMLAPTDRGGEGATCALWFAAMEPGEDGITVGRKHTLPIGELVARTDPFELTIGDSTLTDRGMAGRFDDVHWELVWEPRLPAAEHVHPLLRRARIAKTVLVLPHPDLEVSGTVAFHGRELQLDRARGGQAHLWGSKHAARWTWAHCNDFETMDGAPAPGDYVDGVSVFVPRLGREIGPSTPVVGRFGGRDFRSTSPLRVMRSSSRFGLTSWEVEARDGDRRVALTVDATREELVGVTYQDPDGEEAYCYNSETASMHARVWDREEGEWRLTRELRAPGRAHFEYAQRDPVPGMHLHVR